MNDLTQKEFLQKFMEAQWDLKLEELVGLDAFVERELFGKAQPDTAELTDKEVYRALAAAGEPSEWETECLRLRAFLQRPMDLAYIRSCAGS